ncbi:MAG: methyltransferase domain-containing protein [Pedococcus sp.]
MSRSEAPAFWEAGYGAPGVSTMGGPNHDIVELSAGLPPGARVLDLGCGEGRNALYLAGLGHRVHALDISAAGLDKLASIAAPRGLDVTTEVGDLGEYQVTGQWDLVMAHGVIDYLDNQGWRRLVAEIREHTVTGGWNAYTCMLFTDEYPAPPEFRRAGFKHSLAAGELADTYAAWDVSRHDRYVKWDQHPGIPIHCHPVDKLVVRRPDGGPSPYRRTAVPIGSTDLARGTFDGIELGTGAEELVARCGPPAAVDTYRMPGAQYGICDDGVVDGYELALWFYGHAVMYVVNGRVWGRAIYASDPVRVSYLPVGGGALAQASGAACGT